MSTAPFSSANYSTISMQTQQQQQSPRSSEIVDQQQQQYQDAPPLADRFGQGTSSPNFVAAASSENTLLRVVWEKPLGTTMIPIPRNLLLTNRRLKIWYKACCSLVYDQVTEDPRTISRVVMTKKHGIDWFMIGLTVAMWVGVFILKIVQGSVGSIFDVVSFSSLAPVGKTVFSFFMSLICPQFRVDFYSSLPDPFSFEGKPPCSVDVPKSFHEMRGIEFAIRTFQQQEEQRNQQQQQQFSPTTMTPSNHTGGGESNSQAATFTATTTFTNLSAEERSPLIGAPHANLLLPGEVVLLDYNYRYDANLKITNKRLIVFSGYALCRFPFFDQSVTTEPIENFTRAEYSSKPLHENWLQLGLACLIMSLMFAIVLFRVHFVRTGAVVVGAIISIAFGIGGLALLFYKRSGVTFHSNVLTKSPIFFRIDIDDVDDIEKAFRQL